jgi:alpha-D-ribose 1-methylphosphonate 5-triphosphate synthase subunit PhnI
MYVAVKGGEKAIDNSIELLKAQRRGDLGTPELDVSQITQQLRLSVAKVMNEGALYDPELAALAIKQASGDLLEACFLVRAYRSTLPRMGYTQPIDTNGMKIRRRISATFKDLPGGQLLGATYDYTQRLLDFSLLDSHEPQELEIVDGEPEPVESVIQIFNKENLLEMDLPLDGDPEPKDITREPLHFPTDRPTRLQNLVRSDEGFLLGMAYSTQRGYGHTHPFAAEIKFGLVSVLIKPEELDFCIDIGDIEVTECQMINQFAGSKDIPPQFTRGYGLVFGHQERKAMAMSLVDRSLRAKELGEPVESPAQMEEFVLSHSDSLESSGFVQHLKLPHYVDFQSELELVRRLRVSAKVEHDNE